MKTTKQTQDYLSNRLDEIVNANNAKHKEAEFKLKTKAEILQPMFDNVWELFEVINQRGRKKYFDYKDLHKKEMLERGYVRVLAIFYGNFSRYFIFSVNNEYLPTLTITNNICSGDKEETAIGTEAAIEAVLSFVKEHELVK